VVRMEERRCAQRFGGVGGWRRVLEWIDLSQDREKWRDLANAVMSRLVP
jgi:hypothetical protein